MRMGRLSTRATSWVFLGVVGVAITVFYCLSDVAVVPVRRRNSAPFTIVTRGETFLTMNNSHRETPNTRGLKGENNNPRSYLLHRAVTLRPRPDKNEATTASSTAEVKRNHAQRKNSYLPQVVSGDLITSSDPPASDKAIATSSRTITTATEPMSTATTVPDLLKRLVIVTAISDNHFTESLDMLSSVKQCLPHNKIILYDLGLSKHNLDTIEHSYKMVEIRHFPFHDYSHLKHVKNLFTYAWKPIIIKRVSLEYDVIMYGDASIRMISCDIEKALQLLFNFPFLSVLQLRHLAVEVTHDGMLNYLHYPKEREDLVDMKAVAATGFLLWAKPEMKEKFIEPWLDCALHVECIAPRGAKLGPCGKMTHDGHYVGCHRYDQSALALILAREFGKDFVNTHNQTLSKSIWTIKRM